MLAAEPVHRQCFIAAADGLEGDAFERKLYMIRKRVSNEAFGLEDSRTLSQYPVSMSSRTIIYKGMFLAEQLGPYYLDLADPRFTSALALVHQRFSTNTFPSWRLAHPYRMVAHNGEINTMRGNVNWMAARQANCSFREVRGGHRETPGRSPTRVSPTPPASTTRSSSSSRAATRWPTP